MAETPLVTVLMPVYNAEDFVHGAVQSILDQTYPNLELLIINDGSTDKSAEIIRSYEDSRIQYVENDNNLRLIATLNKGLKLARGKYIARMDADDVAFPDRLQEQVTFMEANPEVGVCGTWYEAFGSKNSIVRYPTDHNAIKYMSLYQCPFCHPTIMFRTSVITDNQIEFDSDYPHAEDYELWGRLSDLCQLANLPKVLLRYRLHDSNISKLENSTQVRNSNRIKASLFKQIDISVSEDDLGLFEKMNHLFRTLTLTELVRIGAILCELETANRKSHYLDQDWALRTVKLKWFDTCSNHSYYGLDVWKLYWSKPNLRYSWTKLPLIMKLLVKTIIKKR
jgi:glycosyltransferase involved in cell wall biosynthesis